MSIPRAQAKVKEARGGSADRTKKTTAPRKSAAPKPKTSPLAMLLGVLESQKQLGGASYPPTLTRLAELTGDPLEVTSKALNSKEGKARVLLSRAPAAAKAAPETTVVLFAEDLSATAQGDRLLELQLQAARTPEEPAVDLARLCKGLLPALGSAFKAALEQRIEERRIPRGIGALPGQKQLFFFLADAVLPPSGTPARSAEAPNQGSRKAADPFAARFDAAFDALDQAAGRNNYVTLHALRAALPDVPRATFDAELSALRRQRRYTLDPSDGRHHQMAEAEREAGIMEAGNLLVYVARRNDS